MTIIDNHLKNIFIKNLLIKILYKIFIWLFKSLKIIII